MPIFSICDIKLDLMITLDVKTVSLRGPIFMKLLTSPSSFLLASNNLWIGNSKAPFWRGGGTSGFGDGFDPCRGWIGL